MLAEVAHGGFFPPEEGWEAQDGDEVPLFASVIFFFPSLAPFSPL